jgi:hypothetical protein
MSVAYRDELSVILGSLRNVHDNSRMGLLSIGLGILPFA